MEYKTFWPGNRVITTMDYDGVKSGMVGTINKRWIGTSYLVRIADGTFRWLDASEFGSNDPSRNFKLKVGDVGILTSDMHHHDFAKVGDQFKVYKIAYEVDYYEVRFEDETKWIGGFMLADYTE